MGTELKKIMEKEEERMDKRSIPIIWYWTPALLLLSIIIASFLSINASAIPPLPDSYYGTFSINHSAAAVGSTLIVKTLGGIQCGTFNVKNSGYYGILTCEGNDNETPATEGPVPGQNISFYYNSTQLLIL